jgi:hypothetical protein
MNREKHFQVLRKWGLEYYSLTEVEGALFKKVVATTLFCRPNKRSPNEPSETEVNVETHLSSGVPLIFFFVSRRYESKF